MTNEKERENMDKYTIYCTPDQVRNALELGAPIKKYSPYTTAPHTHICPVKNLDELEKSGVITDDDKFIVPTAEEMIGWLEEQLKGVICMDKAWSSGRRKWIWIISDDNENIIDTSIVFYLTRKEATIAAIDAALDYLENLKN